MALEQDIAALVAASDMLTQAVEGKIGEIDSKVHDAKQTFDGFIGQARSENAIFRQSKNQFCNVTGTKLDNFQHNSQYTIDVSLYREIKTGIDWAARDAEEQEIMKAMGMDKTKYFQPQIRVMKMVWSGYNAATHSNYSLFPHPISNGSGALTIASYAKLISGSIRGWWLQGITNTWGLCGTHYNGHPGRYIHAHPYVGSASGELLFVWPATASGYVPLDRNAPKWGYWPSIYGDSPYDITPGG